MIDIKVENLIITEDFNSESASLTIDIKISNTVKENIKNNIILFYARLLFSDIVEAEKMLYEKEYALLNIHSEIPWKRELSQVRISNLADLKKEDIIINRQRFEILKNNYNALTILMKDNKC
jgi:hypothetical protein